MIFLVYRSSPFKTQAQEYYECTVCRTSINGENYTVMFSSIYHVKWKKGLLTSRGAHRLPILYNVVLSYPAVATVL